MNTLVKNVYRLIISRNILNINRMLVFSYKTFLPIYDTEYICDKTNQETILQNINIRKGIGDIHLVHKLFDQINSVSETEKERNDLYQLLQQELHKIPNSTHPELLNNDGQPRIIKLINAKCNFDFEPLDFGDIGKKMNILRTDNLGALTGPKSYVFMDSLAQLERALIQYTMHILLEKGFEFVSVPDIIPSSIIEACGMSTKGERNQIYRLSEAHGPGLCLSGTSEISLGGFLAGSLFPTMDKPFKLAAVSRCFRAETSAVAQEKGIYRVHQFTKVEMFVCCHPNHSSDMLEEIANIQEEIFGPLGIHIRQLDMPPHELGAPAYRKYDMEAWMPGRQMWGEVSSCSNCTDYQSRRLGIQYTNDRKDYFVHTLNGTACAIPRLLIAILETHQNKDGTISIPQPLKNFMIGCDIIRRKKKIPEIKLVKSIQKL